MGVCGNLGSLQEIDEELPSEVGKEAGKRYLHGNAGLYVKMPKLKSQKKKSYSGNSPVASRLWLNKQWTQKITSEHASGSWKHVLLGGTSPC